MANLTGSFSGMANLSDTGTTGTLVDKNVDLDADGFQHRHGDQPHRHLPPGWRTCPIRPGRTLKDKNGTYTLTGSNTGTQNNLTGTFSGMANLSDTGARAR